MFNAIEKNSLPEQIVDYFLDAISSGVFKENDKLLPERDLCEKIGVSRSTLREGLRILELMNVIGNGATALSLKSKTTISSGKRSALISRWRPSIILNSSK